MKTKPETLKPVSFETTVGVSDHGTAFLGLSVLPESTWKQFQHGDKVLVTVKILSRRKQARP